MGSGRPGTGNALYRRNRVLVLLRSDVCGLCGHAGATTTDHIISDVDWPRGPDGKRMPGFDDVANLQPAHGTMGNTGEVNYCPVCGKACNQSRGNRKIEVRDGRRSRRW